ncbi:MAG: nitrile hydratase subunit beta [Chloroflexota bacterium]
MNGIHDMGGMHGFGPIRREENEPVFHADWEGTVVAISRVAGALGVTNIDESRYGIEQMEPARYLTASYYERWLDRSIRNFIAKGVISERELDAWIARLQEDPSTPLPTPPNPQAASELIEKVRGGRNYKRPGPEPRYHVGDRVITKSSHPRGHTRLPRYARGKHGIIETAHGTYVFPDTNALGQGEQPQPLYTVRFTAQELWSDTAEPNSSVSLDLWESYLTASAK